VAAARASPGHRATAHRQDQVKVIARAFRWREMLENGTHATIAGIAAVEKINGSYVGRVLRLAEILVVPSENHIRT
jgi:hypothetical protein